MRRRFLEAFPQAKWTTYEPGHTSAARAGSELAFGKAHRTLYDFSRARVILSLDADFVSPSFPRGLANARAFARSRVPEREMSRLYAIESTYTLAGAHADHRLAIGPRQIKAVIAYLDAAISAGAKPLPELGPAEPKPDAPFLLDAKTAEVPDRAGQGPARQRRPQRRGGRPRTAGTGACARASPERYARQYRPHGALRRRQRPGSRATISRR